MDPVLTHACLGCALVIAITWALGLVTGEHSWVDRIWSIVPIPYVAWFAWQTGFADLFGVIDATATALFVLFLIGAVILVGLFQGSTNFTEEITRSKYRS